MRKLLVLYFILFPLNMFCQQHLKMFGIPLSGSIEAFTTKMQNKGMSVDKELSKQLPLGVRAFKGSFAGHVTSQILIFYDTRTKIVFKGTVGFDDIGEQALLYTYNNIREKIIAKHKNERFWDGYNDDGYPKFELVVNFQSAESEIQGTIKMGIIVPKIFPYSKILYVAYEDEINSAKFKESSSNDL